MENLLQDVNQNGQNQPPLDTPSSEDLDTNIAPEGSDGQQGVKQDDRDYKNRYVEADRKRIKAEEEAQYFKNFAEQQQNVMQNFQQRQPQQTVQQQEPEISEEQLIEFEQISPENAAKVRQYREERLVKKVLGAVKSQILPEAQRLSETDRWDQKAVEDFPELNRQGSEFKSEFTKMWNKLKPTGATAVYDVAEMIAQRFPSMQKNKNTPLTQSREDALAQHSVASNVSAQTQNVGSLPELGREGGMITNMFGNDPKKIQERIKGFQQTAKGGK